MPAISVFRRSSRPPPARRFAPSVVAAAPAASASYVRFQRPPIERWARRWAAHRARLAAPRRALAFVALPPAAAANYPRPGRPPIECWAAAWTPHRARLAALPRYAPAVVPPAPAVPTLVYARVNRVQAERWERERWAPHRARLARGPAFLPRWTEPPPPVPEPVAIKRPVWLAEITAYDPELPGIRTLRYGTTGYNHPSAPGYYEPRIVQPANFRRDVFAEATTSGRSRTGFGELVLANPPPKPGQPGPLDALIGYGFDGQPLALKLVGRNDDYASAVTVLKGTMEQPGFTWDRLSLRIRDRQQELDIPIQAIKFAGDNALPDGVEGSADDLKGKPKPIAYGEVFNAPLPLVNTSRLIYQCHDCRIEDVALVKDKGVQLAKGVARATLADLEANIPAASSFDYYLGSDNDGAYIRLGSTPVGKITADLRGDKRGGAYRTSVADIVEEIVTERGGIAAADLVDADFATLNVANPGIVGLWIDSERGIAEVLDELSGSIGAWWGFDRLGRFRLKRLEAPAGAAALTLKGFHRGLAAKAGDTDIISLERIATNDPGRGVPAWRVKLRWKRNHAVLSPTDLAGGVTETDRALFGQEWREAVASDASVQAAHKLSPQLEFASLLADAAAAQAEAERRLALYKVRRDLLRVQVKLSSTLIEAVDHGAVVKLDLPRFDWAAGKLFVVMGFDYDAAGGTVTLDLWG